MRPAMQRKIRAIFAFYFRTMHGVDLHGLEHLPAAGEAAVLVVNHQSLADGCFVATFLPGSPMFAVNTDVARRWWARPFLAIVRSFAVDPTNALAVKAMITVVREGNTLVMFPEGRITTTGSLMKMYDGAAVVADRACATLIAVRIDGLRYGHLSRMPGPVRRRWFCRLSMTVLPPVCIAVDTALSGRARRPAVGNLVKRRMQQAEFEAADTSRSLFAALLGAVRDHGRRLRILEDERRCPLSYSRFLRSVYTLAAVLRRNIAAGDVVGLVLPNDVQIVAAFMALQALGAVPLIFDPKADVQTHLAVCAAAGIATVLTSHAFMDRHLSMDDLAGLQAMARLIWLDDRGAQGIAVKPRCSGFSSRARSLPGAAASPESPAAMMFTQGENGSVHIIRLSHRDILAAIARATPLLSLNSAERILTTVSASDAFGLTLGILLPVLSGTKLFLAPLAPQARKAMELIYDTESTIVVTDGDAVDSWAACADRHDFYRTRIILTRGRLPPPHAGYPLGFTPQLISEVELDVFRPTSQGPFGDPLSA